LAGWAVRRGLRVREKKIKSFLLYAHVSLKKKGKIKDWEKEEEMAVILVGFYFYE
jgi:hypothetical protein